MSPVLEFRFAPGLSRETLLLINVELCLIVATVMEDVVDEDNIEGDDGGRCYNSIIIEYDYYSSSFSR